MNIFKEYQKYADGGYIYSANGAESFSNNVLP